LVAIAGAKEEIRKAGLQVIALSVDRLGEQLGDAYKLMDSMKWPFGWGFVEDRTMDRISELQRALFDRTIPPAVPLALLVDRVGNVVAIYRGEIALTEVMADLKVLDGAEAGVRHKLAPPFAGRWFTKPVDPVYAVEFMARQFDTRLPEEALFYLEAARQRSVGDRRAAYGSELAERHHAMAMKYKNGRVPGLAAEHFQRALRAKPSAEIYFHFGTMLASYGKLVEAQGLLEQALILEPGLPSAQKALVLVRKLIVEGN
jgi:tetratricopeptide (TPR) repeat protein